MKTALRFFAFLMLAVTLPGPGRLAADTFAEPVRPASSADPFIRYYQGNYYLVCTHGDTLPVKDTVSNKVIVYKSPTLAGLAQAEPHEVYDAHDFLESPELWFLDGRWYIYFTTPGANNENDLHVLQSDLDDPLGPYTYQGILQKGAWDSTLLELPGGKRYVLSSPGQNLQIRKMESPLKLGPDAVSIGHIDQSWEKAVPPNGFLFMEAPEVLQHGNDLFVLYTAGDYRTNAYCLGALKLVGSDPMSPASWQKLPGPLFQGDDATSFGAGDCSPFTAADGSTWFCYGAWESKEEGPKHTRSVRAQKLDFDADGLPRFPSVAKLGDTIPEPDSGTAPK
jgi:GH43 family beta-xylosidase